MEGGREGGEGERVTGKDGAERVAVFCFCVLTASHLIVHNQAFHTPVQQPSAFSSSSSSSSFPSSCSAVAAGPSSNKREGGKREEVSLPIPLEKLVYLAD